METFGNCVTVTHLNDPRVAELEKEVARLTEELQKAQSTLGLVRYDRDTYRRNCACAKDVIERLTMELDAATTDRNEVMGERDRLEEKLKQVTTTFECVSPMAATWCRELTESRKELLRLTDELDAATTDRIEVMGERDRIEIKLSQLNTTYKILAEQSAIWVRERDDATEEVERLRAAFEKNRINQAATDLDDAKLQHEIARLKRGEFTSDELAACPKARTDDEVWATLINDKDVEYSVGEHGIERYGFETVTVYRREGREATAHYSYGEWICCYPRTGKQFSGIWRRPEAEAWCVEQLSPPEPKWRPAREDGSDNGKSCRIWDLDGQSPAIRKLLAYEPKSIFGGPWITINEKNGSVTGCKFCEVLE